jgi:hypothetical protein
MMEKVFQFGRDLSQKANGVDKRDTGKKKEIIVREEEDENNSS